MTQIEEVIDDPKCVQILDTGFVLLCDYMGSDSAIVQAARVSYGAGTKSVREDRGLIRYLMRHQHSTPFEMVEFKFHIKAPIFVIRQLIRHRTASVNEISGRYSILEDEFYIPDLDDLRQQSTTNRQGTGNTIERSDALTIQRCIENSCIDDYSLYESLLGAKTNVTNFQLGLSHSFKGLARETARIVLPLNTYTELYWKQDLKNLFHLIKLRSDLHAQSEIRQLADAIYSLVQPICPIACEAFEDYQREALTLSRMERSLLLNLTDESNLYDIETGSQLTPKAHLQRLIKNAGSVKEFAASVSLTERELNEFMFNWNFA